MRQPEKETLIKAVGSFVAERLAAALAPFTDRVKALEDRKPERGEKGDVGDRGEIGQKGDPGLPGERGLGGEKGEAGAPGPAGKDGERGPEGPEGNPGRDGRDGLPGVQGEKGLDGKDGAHGKDGRDGIDGKDALGVADMDVTYDGERTFTFRWTNGERKEERAFVVPMVIDRGVFKSEAEYSKGDAVTFGGSIWIAQEDTKARPESGPEWRLAVKRGRDGKDGQMIPAKSREPVRMS